MARSKRANAAPRQNPCPKCHETDLIRLEQILNGERITQAYFCGRCAHEWHVYEQSVLPLESKDSARRRR
jgi:hypothetical protein